MSAQEDKQIESSGDKGLSPEEFLLKQLHDKEDSILAEVD